MLILSPRNMASMRSRRPDSLGKLEQQLQRLVGDAVLGIVEIDAGGLDHQPLTAPAILGEELAEVKTPDLLVVSLQRRPGRTQVQSGDSHRRYPR